MRHYSPRRLLTIAVVALSVSISSHALADRVRDFVPAHEMRGIGPIRLAIDGMPAPLGKSGLTESSLLASVQARLKERGVPVTRDILANAPQLQLTLLPVEHGGIYYVTIHVRLLEACSVSRNPQLRISSCATWWAYPTIGIVSAGDEARVGQLLLATVDQFADSYAFDNREEGKNE